MKVFLDGVHFTRQNFSLAVHGEFCRGIHLITGAVGSGKSTLALLMAGFLQPERGSVSRTSISSMALSLQFPEYQITGLTVADECRSWGWTPEIILPVCGLIGKDQKSPFSLSRGEQKKLHLACILQKKYDLLLLDEPFSALDCEEKQAFCDRMEHHRQGITIIFTHEQTILPDVDYIWEIIEGELQWRGAPPSALEHWHGAPPMIKRLVALKRTPRNLSYHTIMEAACRT